MVGLKGYKIMGATEKRLSLIDRYLTLIICVRLS